MLVCCVMVAPLQAQQAMPETVRAAEGALRAVRDSAERVRAGIARFRRDLEMAGPETVVGRAQRLTQACAGMRAAFAETTPAFRAPSNASAALTRASQQLLAQMRETDDVLERECESGLRPDGSGAWADSLKAWGPHRTSRIERSLTAIDATAAGFARAAGIDLKPRGS
jgi:hypothetical protein